MRLRIAEKGQAQRKSKRTPLCFGNQAQSVSRPTLERSLLRVAGHFRPSTKQPSPSSTHPDCTVWSWNARKSSFRIPGPHHRLITLMSSPGTIASTLVVPCGLTEAETSWRPPGSGSAASLKANHVEGGLGSMTVGGVNRTWKRRRVLATVATMMPTRVPKLSFPQAPKAQLLHLIGYTKLGVSRGLMERASQRQPLDLSSSSLDSIFAPCVRVNVG